jgi:nitroreductase
MDVMVAIRTRKSVRAYLARPVEDEKLNVVLEAARLAPSASNRQEWRFVVVREIEIRKKLAAAAGGQAFVGEAPVLIVACAETDGHVMRCGQLCYPIDVAIALDHMSLAAVELGLGSCWIGLFDEKKVKEILHIPDEIRVVELMLLGYPADPSAVAKKRLPLDRIVKYEYWWPAAPLPSCINNLRKRLTAAYSKFISGIPRSGGS